MIARRSRRTFVPRTLAPSSRRRKVLTLSRVMIVEAGADRFCKQRRRRCKRIVRRAYYSLRVGTRAAAVRSIPRTGPAGRKTRRRRRRHPPASPPSAALALSISFSRVRNRARDVLVRRGRRPARGVQIRPGPPLPLSSSLSPFASPTHTSRRVACSELIDFLLFCHERTYTGDIYRLRTTARATNTTRVAPRGSFSYASRHLAARAGYCIGR